MADCCGGKAEKRPVASECCAGSNGKNVLLYPCSGGANVGEISDMAARELMFNGKGSMFCLAGLGGDIQGMIQSARDADMNFIIDGCPMGCAKKVFDRVGVSNIRHLIVTDLGIEKTKGVRCSREQVELVASRAGEMIDVE